MIDLLFTIGVVALALGPSIRWFMTSERGEFPESNGHGKRDASGALIWTTFVLVLFMYWNYSRGEKVRTVCRSFQDQIDGGVVSEDQWNRIVDGKWWSVCHPDLDSVGIPYDM